MQKVIQIFLVTSLLWLGVGPQTYSNGGISLDLPLAIAKNNGGGNGNGKGNSAGGAKENFRQNGHKIPRSELKDLNSLNRNINGLLNSSDAKVATFRDLFLNDDGTRKEFSVDEPLIDDQSLKDMLTEHLGKEPSAEEISIVRQMLDRQFEEFKALPEKSDKDDEGNT
ncbi:MAG: hypothetical protein GY763_02980 [Gammaproteobacteria bacterium]|nr:hypothetical protein [Gammaproteobacteria bacterium]